jgi:hypothetical protein
MDKLQLTVRNLGRVFNFRRGRLHGALVWCYRVKLPGFKLKTRPKQLLGYLPLDIVLPIKFFFIAIDSLATQLMAVNLLKNNVAVQGSKSLFLGGNVMKLFTVVSYEFT